MRLRKSIFALSLLYLTSCAGSQEVSITSQTLSNQGLQFIAALVQQFQEELSGSSDCAQFNQVLDDITGTEGCGLGGNQSIQIQGSSCEDPPTFAGLATLALSFQDCREPGQNTGGTLYFELSWNGSLLSAPIQSSDFSFNGLPYSIQNLNIETEGPGTLQCSGVLLIQREICGVTSDCNFCPL